MNLGDYNYNLYYIFWCFYRNKYDFKNKLAIVPSDQNVFFKKVLFFSKKFDGKASG